MAQKPAIPKGTRDFDPDVMARRDYIFSTIKEVFKLYGFEPIETPAMENLSTLTGKYGDEGDKLLFRILNSGDFLSDVKEPDKQSFETLGQKISEKGLRYDLTVPFARFVVQYRNEINFPFKRYQIQPVWRADRPQKGRYREFYQCDVDVVGSDALINEAELVQLVDDVFKRLNINVVTKINNRKVLAGLAEYIGKPEALIDITVAIDKLDKIGIDQVNAELSEKGLSDKAVELLQPVLFMEGSTTEKLDMLEKLIGHIAIGSKGITELRQLFTYLYNMKIAMPVELDLTLARGLNYYTGAIFEVKATDVPMGSICGGGRYDNLTGVFGMPDVSGVGISFGADRIYDVMQNLELFPDKAIQSTQIIFLNFGEKEMTYCLPFLKELRAKGFRVEIFPDAAKIKKQLRYTDQKRIPIAVMAGESEMAANQFTVKQMQSGEQITVDAETLVEKLGESLKDRL
ncbi:MAG: histidine--tRNA ligase [Bacteroidales bacterium]|nr:histidine--tRNA ligase [Bacteroidales bacterium]HOI31659.1 histidine--tRNA ligase [Bacteroidales bacterium]